MMIFLITAHLAAAALAPALVRWLDRRAFVVLALVPALAFGWVLTRMGTVTGHDAVDVVESHQWVDSVGMTLSFRLSTLSALMTALVTGVGALVLFYCRYYFRDGDRDLGRFAGVFTAFAGVMLGLVLADDLLVLYVFWELTTVFSYLLIGHNPERKANRRAAMQALIVTTLGGLAMLVGFIMIGEAAGTYRISAVLADPPIGGGAITVALVLVLVGALSKSALVPFHFWLPGAMAAPTPVSAYLHAAAMVKAGVYLVALFAPAFADVAGWRPVVLTLGVVTMVLGGIRALRQHDLKLLLAYGTVSQLGFLIVLGGLGTRSAALADAAMIVTHALFKATLFLVVGIIDRSAGTRDLRELSGLRTRMPVVFWASVLAVASMAALPPTAGFVTKETAFAALVDLAETGDGTGLGTAAGWAILVGLVLGSLLTVAYSARFLWGAFGTKAGVTAGVSADAVRPVPAGFAAPVVLLAIPCLALGFLGAAETAMLEPYADQFAPGAHHASLALWHGFTQALVPSLIAIAGGLVLFWKRDAIERLRLPGWPAALDAETGYRGVMRGVDRLAVEVTGRTQRGSLPIYLGVVLVTVVVVPGGALLLNRDWGETHWWDTPAQAVVGAVMVVAAVLTAQSRRRLKAVVLAGVVGYGMAMLFMLHGAPDLALTQVLVETVTLVIFVLVLRRLPPYFSDSPLSAKRWWRVAIGLAVGLVMAGIALAAGGARTADPVGDDFAAPAVDYGGGKNIVNVTLVDTRAWDTMGEISVLVVAATGVASLIFLITGRTGRWRPSITIAHAASASPSRPASDPPADATGAPPASGRVHRNTWLRAGRTLAPDRRSIIFEVITRLAFHTIIVFSVYLLFSGHNLPGGGFAGGLVAGLALMVRYLAGGRHELDEAAPVEAGLVLGLGLFVATGAGLIPLVFGGEVLQSAVVDLHLPLLGDVHLVTSLFFDVGVYLVVVGLMLDVLRSLGGGIDGTGDGESGTADNALETAGEAR